MALTMTRKRFLWLVLLFVITVCTSLYLLKDFDSVVRSIIKKDTAKLRVNDEIIDQFIAEAVKEKKWDQFNFQKKAFIKFCYFFSNPIFSLPMRGKYIQYRSFIVRNFLLSTDFFIHKMDTDSDIRYIGLHNPYKRPCSNPFSNIYYDANTIING